MDTQSREEADRQIAKALWASLRGDIAAATETNPAQDAEDGLDQDLLNEHRCTGSTDRVRG